MRVRPHLTRPLPVRILQSAATSAEIARLEFEQRTFRPGLPLPRRRRG
jgi:hypothetical protein